MAISKFLHLNPNAPKLDWNAAYWLFPYLIGMAVISFFGGFGLISNGVASPSGIIGGVGPFAHFMVGGFGKLPLFWDLGVVTVFSLVIYYTAMHFRLSEAKVDEYAAHLYPPEGEVTAEAAEALY
jgi:hypothetical protein